jgi:hypothetical protein
MYSGLALVSGAGEVDGAGVHPATNNPRRTRAERIVGMIDETLGALI